MARATTRTKLSLDRWAQLMGIHPLHFNQVILPDMPPSVCAQPWLQHAWQSADRVGREDLAVAIAEAESLIEQHLHARLLPSWEVDEWQATVRPADPTFYNITSKDIRRLSQVVEASWKHFVSGGIELRTLIEAGAAIAYSDDDGDGYDETATVSVAVSFADACQVRVYVSGEGGADEAEIRPVNVSIAAGTATITFRRELAVLDDLLQAFDADAVDGTADANFLVEGDVYRVQNDPQQQATLMWEPFASCVVCSGTGCEQCAFETQTACLRARGEPRNAMLSYEPGDWDADTETFLSASLAGSRQPDVVRLWHYAGIRDTRLACPTNRMAEDWERAVAYFAAARLERPLCECNNAHAWVEHWRRDLAIRGEEGLSIARADLDNPFGTLLGAVNAWRKITTSRDLAGR